MWPQFVILFVARFRQSVSSSWMLFINMNEKMNVSHPRGDYGGTIMIRFLLPLRFVILFLWCSEVCERESEREIEKRARVRSCCDGCTAGISDVNPQTFRPSQVCFPAAKRKKKKKLARFMRNAYNLLQFLWFLWLFLYYVRRASCVERNVHRIFSSAFSVKRGRDFLCVQNNTN